MLVDANYESGYHSVVWNGLDMNSKAVSSGVYIYTLTSDGLTISNKMILMK